MKILRWALPSILIYLISCNEISKKFIQPEPIQLSPPVKSTEGCKLRDTASLSLLLDENGEIYFYKGELNLNPDNNNIMETNYSDTGLHKVVNHYNQWVISHIKPLEEQLANHIIADSTFKRFVERTEESKLALYVVIKTGLDTKYANVIKVLDEMEICYVGKYALIDETRDDKKMVLEYRKKHRK